jgi:hypothetical protein
VAEVREGEHAHLRVLDRHGAVEVGGDRVGQGEQVAERDARGVGDAARPDAGRGGAQERVDLAPGHHGRDAEQGKLGGLGALERRARELARPEDDAGRAHLDRLLDERHRVVRPDGEQDRVGADGARVGRVGDHDVAHLRVRRRGADDVQHLGVEAAHEVAQRRPRAMQDRLGPRHA